MFRRWIVLAMAVLVTSTGVTYASSILILRASEIHPAPVDELSGGYFDTVDEFDIGEDDGDTPTLAFLGGYSIVLAYTDSFPQEGVGDVLADYVDGGGRALIATFGMSCPRGISGRISDSGYNPLRDVGENGYISGNIEALVSGDRVFDTPNIIDLDAISYYMCSEFAHPALDSGATLIADDGAGIGVFALNADETVGGLNLFPGVIDGNNSEFYEFLENALVRVLPEPGALTLFALGVLAVMRRRR